MKRAQAEIIGLLLIVILLAIGFLLYIRFGLSENRNYQAEFAQTQLGQSFVHSLAKTELVCGSQTYSVADLIKEVAQGTSSCQAETALERLINETLESTHWLFGSNYRLVIVKKLANGEETIGIANFTNPEYPIEEQCNVKRRMVHDSDHHPIPAYGGLLSPVHIRLEQC